jgi:hypothetical protein
MTHLIRFGSLLAFGGLLVSVAVATSPEARRRRVNALLLYFLLLSAAVGFAQRDDWPFSPYRIFYDYKAPGHLAYKITLRVFDTAGRECDVDPRFASPVILPNLGVWFERTYPTLGPDDQERAMAFLMEKAREAGQRLAGRQDAGHAVGLTWLAAPPHWGLYALSSAGDFARCLPYAGLRVYREGWRPSDKARDPARISRDLIAEYHPS